MRSVLPSNSKAKPSRSGVSAHAATLPKNSGLLRYGAPSSGQNTSQLPHSLQASANTPICHGLSSTISPVASVFHPVPFGTRRSIASRPLGIAKTKFASLGQTGMHLSQVRQSNSVSRVPIFFGGVALAAAA